MRLSNVDYIAKQFDSLDSDGIKGVSVITIGEAKGHGVDIDLDFITEVMRQGNSIEKGIKSRFGHPDMFTESLGTEIGIFKNFRIAEGNTKILADFTFIKTKYNDAMIDHVLTFASAYPESFGVSIEFIPKTDDMGYLYTKEKEGKLYIELDQLRAVDFVSTPAANPNGLFSGEKVKDLRFAELHEKVDNIEKSFEAIKFDIRLLFNILNKNNTDG